MGIGLVDGSVPGSGEGESPRPLSPHPYTDIFEQHLPYYLSIGMTWDQYWNGDSTMVKAYREAAHLRNKRENQMMWVMGAYIYRIFEEWSPIYHGWTDKNAKPEKYVEEPFPLTKREVREREEEKERERERLLREKFYAWRNQTNRILMKREVKDDGR